MTLVESEDIGTVRVGGRPSPARTFGTARHRLKPRFMRATQATLPFKKLGISFEHWGEIGGRYILVRPGRQIDLDGRFPSLLAAGARAGRQRRLGDYCLS
ncbi:tryptophan 7-halogenase [Caulobacter segnis]